MLALSFIAKSEASDGLMQDKNTLYSYYLACFSLLEPEKMLSSCGGYSEQAKELQADYRTKYKTLTALLN